MSESNEPDARPAGEEGVEAPMAPMASMASMPPLAPSVSEPDGLSNTTPDAEPDLKPDSNPDLTPAGIPDETPDAAPPGATPVVVGVGPQPLDPRSITVDRITNWIVAGVFIIALGVYLVIQWMMIDMLPRWQLATVGGGLALIAGLVFRAQWYPPMWHRLARYEVTPIAIEISTGVVFRTVMTVPRSRVQHTDVTQGPLMRRYGVATLVIYTAGTQHAKVSLHGLSRERADAIRDLLIAHVGAGHDTANHDTAHRDTAGHDTASHNTARHNTASHNAVPHDAGADRAD